MKFGIFFLCEQPPWQSQAAAYHDAIDQAAYADALGFDAVWIAEHHFSEYGIVPDVAVLAGALAQRVRRMRIGTAVSILPFTHPIRAAESFAMVDQLSGFAEEVTRFLQGQCAKLDARQCAFAGRPLRLVRAERPGGGVDRARGPVSLVSEASAEQQVEVSVVGAQALGPRADAELLLRDRGACIHRRLDRIRPRESIAGARQEQGRDLDQPMESDPDWTLRTISSRCW